MKVLCYKVLEDFARAKPAWKYVKSKKTFERNISKYCSFAVSTGFASKVDFVNFEFGLEIVHKLVSKAISRKKSNLLIFWHRQCWDPAPVNNGRCTVYDHHHPHLGELDDMRSQGKLNYVRLEEFPERLNAVFTLAEAEIAKLFDLSSEEALIQSIVDKPIGFFRPNEVLLVQLLQGNLAYYDELTAFYGQSIEDIRSSPYRVEPFSQPAAEQLMERYRQGDFPKFDFV